MMLKMYQKTKTIQNINMKYLKTFEGREPAYKYLSNENAEKIEVVIRDFI